MDENKKPKIMILGTFHMRYTPDIFRVDLDDLLSAKRQNEIMEVVRQIERFAPTKVAFEVVKSEDALLNKEYQEYLEGKLELRVDEVHQLGFRLAANLNHNKVYAVDWMETVGNRGLGQVFEWAKEYQSDLYESINEKYRDNHQTEMEEKSVNELILTYNHAQFVSKEHEMYMAVARIGTNEDYIGIDWVRWWYQRNLIIYKNLADMIESSSDRILLIIGGAHIHLISQFLQESGLFDVVKATEYLEPTNLKKA